MPVGRPLHRRSRTLTFRQTQLSPMPISSPYCIIGVPGSEKSRLKASSSRRRSLPSIGARRRLMPRSYSCIRFSGPNASNTFWRCSGVSRPRSSSSWLRRNCTHCAFARPAARVLERADQRIEIAGGQRVEQPLVHREVEHHLQPVAFVAEILHAFVRRHIRFGQHDRLPGAPLQEIAHLLQQVEILLVLDAGALLFDQERHRVHAEAGHAELQPETHDLLNLGAHVRMPRVQVRLMIVEAMEIVLARALVLRPGRRLLARKDDAVLVVLRPHVGPDVPVAEKRAPDLRAPAETTANRSRCG